jgi:ATP/maltotriose-dependent transcriptional regulator MalT
VTQWAVGDEDSQVSSEAALAAARETGDSRMVGDALFSLAMQRHRGDPDRSALYEEALEHLRRAGDLMAVSLVLTWLIIEQGSATYEDAMETRSVLNEQLKISDELGTNNLDDTPVINLSLVECYLGNTDLANSLARLGTLQSRRIGRSPAVMLWPALTLGICAARRGQYERAAELLGAVESCEQPWYDQFGDTWQSSERQM